jgi:hypothetical protein
MSTTLTNQGAVAHIATGLLPFMPVKFEGGDTLLAIGRIAAYGLLAYATYNKMRNVSYALMGAAGLSLITSISASFWNQNAPYKATSSLVMPPIDVKANNDSENT